MAPPKPRSYQLQCLCKAREGNVIVCLETGCGKTLIAALLIKELAYLFSSSMPYIAVFLVPTVMLVQQQANVLREYANVKVGQYNGQSNCGMWDTQKWENDVYNLEVLVMTPQILLNVLRHGLLKMEVVKVLIFDECHHCQKGHPYARIMKEYYKKVDINCRPKILGLTASPVIRKGKSEVQCAQDISSLESLLNAKIITVKDRMELEATVLSPTIKVKEYHGVYHSHDTLRLLAERIKGHYANCIPIPAGNVRKRNNMEGSAKFCRDVEYCIYELGLWFARHAAKYGICSDICPVEEGIEDEHLSTSTLEFSGMSKEIHEWLDHAIKQGGDIGELEVENLKPDLVSNKVIALVDVLFKFRSSKLKCIVFVERVVTAKLLAYFLCKILKTVQCEHIVGNHAKMGSSSRKDMLKKLEDFRSGTVDLLVATNVAEEGLDIQNCCLVVHFDMPKTLRSFIQARGRARVRYSDYVVLVDKTNVLDEQLLDTLRNSESFVNERILTGLGPSVKSEQREDDCKYVVESTGATVNIHSGVELLYRYCSKLPSDEFYQPQPSFIYVEESDGIQCSAIMPSNAPIRLVIGDICESHVLARKIACLKACILLHSTGALTDYLIPQSSPINADGATSSDTKAKTEDLQATITPTLWLPKVTNSATLVRLHSYKLSFQPSRDERKYSSFALLLQTPLPKEAANSCETLHLRHGRPVVCRLEPLENVFLNTLQVTQAQQFQTALFTVLLDRNLEHRAWGEEHLPNCAWYLLLPLQGDEDHQIDWKRICQLRAFASDGTAKKTTNDCARLESGIVHFANATTSVEDIPGLLVRTIHHDHLYCIIDAFKDLHVLSPFPNSQFKDYAEYYKSRYNCDLKHQSLLKARFLREAHNCLQRTGSLEPDIGSSDVLEKHGATEASLVELPPEICSILYCGMHDDLVNAAVILPSLMHRLEGSLVAIQLRNELSSEFSQGSLVSVEKVLEAITTQKCLEPFCLERLELLGDSFLKYAVSCNLFLAHEGADEGFLSLQRKQRICNASLFKLASNFGLPGYIRDGLFNPNYWVAPCHRCKVVCDESNVSDLHGASSQSKDGKAFVVCNKRHRWMHRKTVADSFEALVGAYLEDGGECAALSFLKSMGSDVHTDVEQISKIRSASEKNISLTSQINIEALEKFLSYSFKHKGLLVEAFTHASFNKHLGKCYQRLEFLGDSVLDFLVTRHLYKQYKESKPGKLTDMRSAIVSNESFARIVVQHKLYAYIIENSAELVTCIRDFVSYVHASSNNSPTGEWDGDKCPKVLGDILEALAGAIFVDAEFDLDLVWRIFQPLLQPLIAVADTQLHPVRELLELCQKMNFPCDKSSCFEGDSIQCHYIFEVHVANEVVSGVATAKDKKSAKRQAAFCALANLKVLGYIHPCKSETLVGSSGMKERKKISMPLDVGAGKYASTKNEQDAATIPSCRGEHDAAACEKPTGSVFYECNVSETSTLSSSAEVTSPTTFARPYMSSFVWESSKERDVGDTHVSFVSPPLQGAGTPSGHVEPDQELMPASGPSPFTLGTPSDEGETIIKFCHLGLTTVAVQASSSGNARTALYEACAKKRWKAPSFRCSYQEGPPHDKWFTYDVILQLPQVGQVECCGDPQRTSKAAMDSAALELLHWLTEQGFS